MIYVNLMEHWPKLEKIYFITSIDDFFDYILWKVKLNHLACLRFCNKFKNQVNRNIKRLCNDKGTKYDSYMFNNFYKVHGIKHETTLSYPSKINDKFERKDINFIE